MEKPQALIINGSPGSGKSTLANHIGDRLRAAGTTHAIIDVDELARIFPENDPFMQWRNLGLIWPSYAAVPGQKAIIPVLIDTDEDLRQVKAALSGANVTVCELVAPTDVLRQRVTKREPNEYWRSKLRGLVDGYAARPGSQKYGDFQVDTAGQAVEDSATQILGRLGWQG